MKTRTKHLLEIAVLLLMLAAAPLLARWMSVPPWVALCLLVFLVGICIALACLRNIVVRRCEADFVHKELEQNETPPEPPSEEVTALEALQETWQVALENLNASHLKKVGDPVHALPWYLVLGGNGSGKSSALYSSRLSSPFFPTCATPPAATENCRFWFFEKSVVIDTAGRYAFPVYEKEDREEWETFLTLLAKHRRKEPLNGVVLTVAVDRLLCLDPDIRSAEAGTLRQRLDELMRVFKVKFPVYVLVTKCDLIEGMEPFAALLAEGAVEKPMGRVNAGTSEDAETFTAQTIAAVADRLRSCRLQLLNSPRLEDAATVALFPEEFSLLKEPLTAFVSALFRENPYQETPVLRGLFFGSGAQKGHALSLLPGTVDSVPKRRRLAGGERGLFLQELFGSVIPRDRSLLSPTRKGIQWRAMTANLGFMSWALVMIALCGLLGFSFIKNLRAIRVASAQLAAPLAGGSDLEALERYRVAIAKVEAQNRGWIMPRLGLTESLEVERGLKERYCRRFQKAVLAPLDKELAQKVAHLTPYSPDSAYCQYAMHLARRLNILKARVGGAGIGELQKRALPAAPIPPEEATSRALQEPARRFGKLYLCYLAWSEDSASLNSEAQLLQGRLKEILALKEGNLRWLCHWVEHNEGLTPLTLASFWGGVPSGENEPVLYPTYTRKGMARLKELVAELEAATGKKGGFDRARADLEGWQRSASFAAWHDFALDFSRGVKRLRGNSEWQRVAASIGTERGPYLALMNRLTWELEPLSHGGGLPLWLRQLYLVQGARTQRAAPYDGIMAKAADTGARALGGLKQKLSRGGAGGDALQEAAAAWREYLTALSVIAPAAASRGQSFQLAAQTFSDDPATGRSPFFAAYHALNRMRLGVGADSPLAEVPARLITGPMEFLWFYIRKEAAAQLQDQWEQEVVPGAAELPSPQATQVLLGPDGLAWKFAKGPAAPFLVRTEHGFRPKEVLGSTLPLDGAFFSFMARGTQVVASALSKQSSYTVGIKALPTEANLDATTHPHATRLDLLCTGNTQTLVNLNYPTGKTFYWAPESCSDTVLKVEVGDLVLTKRYGGPNGFPSFLSDFRGGSRTFAISEFPGEAGALERMGIRQVRVNYNFTGSAPVIKQNSAAQAHVPRSIGKSY